MRSVKIKEYLLLLIRSLIILLVVAAFAEKLRQSYWVRNLSYDQILAHLAKIPAPLAKRGDVQILRQLIQTARRLDNRGDKFAQSVPVQRMDFDRVPVLR